METSTILNFCEVDEKFKDYILETVLPRHWGHLYEETNKLLTLWRREQIQLASTQLLDFGDSSVIYKWRRSLLATSPSL